MTVPEDPAGRDDLDRRIERGLRLLTDPATEPFAVRDLLTRRQPTRRWASWRAAMAAAASIALAIGAVFSIQSLRGTPSASPSSTSGVVAGSAAPSSGVPADTPEGPVEVDVAAWVEAAWPAVIPGRFGTLDSTAYDRDPGTTLGHAPPIEGPFAGQWGGGPAVTTYQQLADPRELADTTQLVVRGRPLAFSRPRFNSSDGSFWMTELIGVRDGVNSTADLQRDVLFQVDEVLGTTLPGGFEPGLIQFTATAGNVVVEVPSDVPYDQGYGDGVLEAGRYLIREQPTADLRLGEEVVLFLKYGGWLGLYGERYGELWTLSPAHPLYYAFRVEGEGTTNLSAQGPPGDQWNASMAGLREIAGGLAPRAGQPLPDARVHPARPSHDSSEQPLPSPTPCSPRSVQGYWFGYRSLDALLADSDLVVVARPTTRAREVGAQADDALVVLANDALVEMVVAGDASAGNLLPVEQLAGRDPACPLVIDGNEPLQIDRPYLMALRRDGDAFVLPEAPRALAEVRDGRLASSRWPELDGLAIAEARARLAVSGGLGGLEADLEAGRATVVELGTFTGEPFAGSDVRLCVGGQQVDAYIYDSAADRAADAALIDPDDPSHIGRAIAEWQGRARFWQRDRIIVLYLGGDEKIERLLTSVLGQPFAQDVPGPSPFDASCPDNPDAPTAQERTDALAIFVADPRVISLVAGQTYEVLGVAVARPDKAVDTGHRFMWISVALYGANQTWVGLVDLQSRRLTSFQRSASNAGLSPAEEDRAFTIAQADPQVAALISQLSAARNTAHGVPDGEGPAACAGERCANVTFSVPGGNVLIVAVTLSSGRVLTIYPRR